MKRYTALIAPTDDYHGTGEELAEAWQNDHPAVYHIDFEVPDGTSNRLIVLIARGLFWEDQWTMGATVSTVIEDLTPEDTRPLGEDRTGVSTKDVDLWSDRENEWDDKVNW